MQVKIGMKGRKPRFGLIEAIDRVGRGDANLAQVGGLSLQLLERLLVQPSKSARFAVERFFERPNPAVDVQRVGSLRRIIARMLPFTKRQAEPVQLRLVPSETLFQLEIFLSHRGTFAKIIHKSDLIVTTGYVLTTHPNVLR